MGGEIAILTCGKWALCLDILAFIFSFPSMRHKIICVSYFTLYEMKKNSTKSKIFT